MNERRRDLLRTVFYVGGVEFGLVIGGLVGLLLLVTDRTGPFASTQSLPAVVFMASSLLVGYTGGCVFGLVMYAFKERVLSRFARKMQ